MSEYKRLTERDISKETRQKLCIVLCDIRRRCLNPDYKYFYLYGERGISVCEEWLGKDGQKNFREWAVNNGYEKGLTIDRIDNNKGYSPDNCRWVTAKEQSYNRRSNKLITIHGKTQTVTEWAKETGIPIGTIQNRLKYGWEEDRLLEPKQVYLKMSKHEMRVEILKLRKEVKEYKTKIESGKLVELPFCVFDKKKNKEADCYKIALKEDWAKCLCYCDMEGFAITQDGMLILLDECGRYTYCPDNRFKVVAESELEELRGKQK